MPSANVVRRLASPSSCSLRDGAIHISSQRSTPRSASTPHRTPMTQSSVSHTVCRTRGIASASVSASTSTRDVAYCTARRRSLALRTRSARSSERAVIAINAAKTKIVSTTRIARPSSTLNRACRVPQSLSHARIVGIRIAAGRSRRASTPPASLLAKIATKPRSGRAQKIPTPSTKKATALGKDIGLCSPMAYIAPTSKTYPSSEISAIPIGTSTTSCAG